jgi:TPR repeat protein
MKRLLVFSISASMVMILSTAALAEDRSPFKSKGCEDGMAAKIAGDATKAVAILQPLADAGEACAQFMLGSMYRDGDGVQKDKAKALELLQKAADQGYPGAKYMAEALKKYPSHHTYIRTDPTPQPATNIFPAAQLWTLLHS